MARHARNSTAFAARVLAKYWVTRYGGQNSAEKILRRVALSVLASIVFSVGCIVHAQAYTETVIHNFCTGSCHEGGGPIDGLVRGVDGNLYGVTDNNPRGRGHGSVFAFVPTGAHWKLQVLYRFKGPHHVEPRAGLIVDVSGNIFGVARDQIFELKPNADRSEWTLSTIYGLCHRLRCGRLGTPIGRLTYAGAASGAAYDGVSPLYGVTQRGGAHNGGVIYKLQRDGDTWSLSTLHSFCEGPNCPDGMSPVSGLLATADGLYGVTDWGGNLSACGVGCGVVYQLSSSAKGRDRNGHWKYTVLHAFCVDSNCSDGKFPLAELSLDGTGALIGTAEDGGTSGQGVIFKLTPNGTHFDYSVLHSFCSACGETIQPQSEIMIDRTGAMFGAANRQPGDLYRFDGSTMTTLHHFCSRPQCRDGDYPTGKLLLDSSGNLIGTTMGGGNSDAGTIFELKP